MTSETVTSIVSSHSQWTAPEDGKWTSEDAAHQHLDDLLEVRAGACLQLTRLAAGGELDATSALAVVEQAIGKVVHVYDDTCVELDMCHQPSVLMPVMADLYFEMINQK